MSEHSIRFLHSWFLPFLRAYSYSIFFALFYSPNVGSLTMSASMIQKACLPLCLPPAKSVSDGETENKRERERERESLCETIKDKQF